MRKTRNSYSRKIERYKKFMGRFEYHQNQQHATSIVFSNSQAKSFASIFVIPSIGCVHTTHLKEEDIQEKNGRRKQRY